MKNFTQYLIESKDRFIKKNKNLTKDQKKELIKFFKTNRQAENKIDWNKSSNMTYDDFLAIMMETKSGRKTKIKHQKIKGLTEGKDYIHVRMKTKEYLAYIPLTFDAAQKFNTKELGVCSGPWCIGHSGNAYHWNEEVIQEKQVPVYVVNTRSKWVVMIDKGNRKYNIWSIENVPSKVHEGIPNFSIRKELLDPKQKKLYDEIREDYYDEEEETEIDVTDATNDYEKLIDDIDNAASKTESAKEEFDNETYAIKEETKEKFKEQISNAQEEINEKEKEIEEWEEIVEDIDYLDETDYEDGVTDFRDEYYTEDEIEKYKRGVESDIDDNNREIEEYQSDMGLADDQLRQIDDIEPYEMADAEIDWIRYPPLEDDMYDDIDIPSVDDMDYSDYIDVMTEHGSFWSNNSSVDDDIREYVYYSYYGGSSYSSAEELLNDNDLYHPESVNEN